MNEPRASSAKSAAAAAAVARMPPELVAPQPLLYEGVLRRALEEDLGGAGDLTTDAVVLPGARARGRLVARAAGRLAGVGVALDVLRLLDPRMRFDVVAGDGADVESGQLLATVAGQARALLSAERTALNFLGRLSGVATATARLVAAVAGHDTRVVCTRKTTPGLRVLERYAVRAGGGANHRFGLDDAVLVKDNHIAVAGGVTEALERVRSAVGHTVTVEVEVGDLEQLDEALRARVHAVLLDNMPPDTLREAVAAARGRALTEASGGITPDSAAEAASSGVDLISAGWITHSAPALDVAFEVEGSPR